MPTIIPSYVYSLFAALLVGSIIVYSCSLVTSNIKNQATNEKLRNIDEYIAAQSLTLLSQTEDSQNSTKSLDIPTQIGNQIFWIQISNDSSGAWVESGLGTTVTSSEIHVSIPAAVNASGIFVSSSGRAELQCHSKNQIATLILTNE
jgi:hypothetical protein